MKPRDLRDGESLCECRVLVGRCGYASKAAAEPPNSKEAGS
jgi:hypothetical protein